MRSLLVGALVVALLAGCGGDSDDGADRTTSSTARDPVEARHERERRAYVRRVDALCRDANPQLKGIMAALTRARDAARSGQAGLPETFETFARLLRRAQAVSGRLETRMRAVAAPEGERSFHEHVVESVQKGSANLREQIRAAEARDSIRLRDLSVRGSVINAEGKGLIKAHGGFRHCGKA